MQLKLPVLFLWLWWSSVQGPQTCDSCVRKTSTATVKHWQQLTAAHDITGRAGPLMPSAMCNIIEVQSNAMHVVQPGLRFSVRPK